MRKKWKHNYSALKIRNNNKIEAVLLVCRAASYLYNRRFDELIEMFKEYPDVVTPEDLQKMLHIGRNAVYKLLCENLIKSIKIGKKYIIPKVNVIKYLTAETVTV